MLNDNNERHSVKIYGSDGSLKKEEEIKKRRKQSNAAVNGADNND